MVGYHYQILWKLPGDAPIPLIQGQTRNAQTRLLQLGQRVARGTTGPLDHAAMRFFDLLRETFQNELKPDIDEDWALALFTYDTTSVKLRPAFRTGSSSTTRTAA